MNKIIDDLLSMIHRENKKIYIWFRDDDAGIDSDALKKLVYFFDTHSIPLLVAVIPERLTIGTTTLLNSSSIVSIGQHGYSHINYAPEGSPPSELTDGRDIQILTKEQLQGHAILKKYFNDKYLHCFIPPYFEISTKVLSELEKIDYTFFSSWWTNGFTPNGIPELNVQVDFVDWNNGEKFAGDEYVLFQFQRELENFLLSKQKRCIIGVVLHHELMDLESYYMLESIYKYAQKNKFTIISSQTALSYLQNEGKCNN